MIEKTIKVGDRVKVIKGARKGELLPVLKVSQSSKTCKIDSTTWIRTSNLQVMQTYALRYNTGKTDMTHMLEFSRYFIPGLAENPVLSDVFEHMKDFYKGGGDDSLTAAVRVLNKEYPFLQEEVCKVLTNGALKYGRRNWRKGLPFVNTLASAMRHLIKFIDGEQNDQPDKDLAQRIVEGEFDESVTLEQFNTHHLAHVIVNLMFIHEWSCSGMPGLDDRLKD